MRDYLGNMILWFFEGISNCDSVGMATKRQSKKPSSFLKKGILAGWRLKSIQRNDFLKGVKKEADWKSIKKDYRSFEASIRIKV